MGIVNRDGLRAKQRINEVGGIVADLRQPLRFDVFDCCDMPLTAANPGCPLRRASIVVISPRDIRFRPLAHLSSPLLGEGLFPFVYWRSAAARLLFDGRFSLLV